jgi:hypothetical protein
VSSVLSVVKKLRKSWLNYKLLQFFNHREHRAHREKKKRSKRVGKTIFLKKLKLKIGAA